MIRLTIKRHQNDLINNRISIIVVHQLNQLLFHSLIIFLLITYPVQSELNLTKSSSSDLIDSDELTTDSIFLNPVTLPNNSVSITESTLIVDLTTIISNSTINPATDQVNSNETLTIRPTTINPNHVTIFLDADDEVNTLPSTINSNGTNNLTESDLTRDNEIINSSSSSSSSPTISPNQGYKPSTLPNEKHSPINQSPPIIESETTTILTIDMIDGDTINSTVINSPNNETVSTTDLLIDKRNQTICDQTRNQITDHQRLTIDHYEAKKFFLFTMILLGLCCLLILIVLILVVYIFRKLTRERTIKMPQVNNNNHHSVGGSIEFDTIKDGRFYQWQGNVNSGFDSSDLNESTTQSTGYRFLEGSVVPYSDRYHNDLKASSTETFGHHHHLNQSSLSSINSLPKSSNITTVDTRL